MDNNINYLDEIAVNMKKWDDDFIVVEGQAINAANVIPYELLNELQDLKAKKSSLEIMYERFRSAKEDARKIPLNELKENFNSIRDALEKTRHEVMMHP
ncbi:MAG: hypothetical protein PHW27_12815 [Melioribacteraceae bacterium]|nr:hypothetical protein [Melioribacteraceae bacterium]MDD3559441.1 hypothetical protein [Melioribacteraceae bacterium]